MTPTVPWLHELIEKLPAKIWNQILETNRVKKRFRSLSHVLDGSQHKIFNTLRSKDNFHFATMRLTVRHILWNECSAKVASPTAMPSWKSSDWWWKVVHLHGPGMEDINTIGLYIPKWDFCHRRVLRLTIFEFLAFYAFKIIVSSSRIAISLPIKQSLHDGSSRCNHCARVVSDFQLVNLGLWHFCSHTKYYSEDLWLHFLASWEIFKWFKQPPPRPQRWKEVDTK